MPALSWRMPSVRIQPKVSSRPGLSPFAFPVVGEEQTIHPLAISLVKSKTVFLGGAARFYAEESRGLKANRLRDITRPRRRRGVPRRVSKPVDFPFGRFPERRHYGAEKRTAGWPAGQFQSQEREARSRLRSRFVTPYQRRVFRTQFEDRRKETEVCRKRDNQRDRTGCFAGGKDWQSLVDLLEVS